MRFSRKIRYVSGRGRSILGGRGLCAGAPATGPKTGGLPRSASLHLRLRNSATRSWSALPLRHKAGFRTPFQRPCISARQNQHAHRARDSRRIRAFSQKTSVRMIFRSAFGTPAWRSNPACSRSGGLSQKPLVERPAQSRWTRWSAPWSGRFRVFARSINTASRPTSLIRRYARFASCG